MNRLINTYSLNVGWSEEDKAYMATSPDFPTLSAFGDTPEEALREGQVVLEAFIDTYLEQGWTLPKPRKTVEYSGKLNVRMPRSLHAALAREAEAEGVSLNTLIVTALSRLRPTPNDH